MGYVDTVVFGELQGLFGLDGVRAGKEWGE